MPPKAIKDATKEDCEKWRQNPTINPLSRRTITVNGPTYLQLQAHCEQFLGTAVLELSPEDKYLMILMNGKPEDLKQFFAEPSSQSIHPAAEISKNVDKWPWLIIIGNKKRSNEVCREMLNILHNQLLKSLSLTEIRKLYSSKTGGKLQTSLWKIAMEDETHLGATLFVCDIWPVDELVKVKINKEDIIIHYLKNSRLDVIDVLFKRKIPITNQNNLTLWAAHFGQFDIYKRLVNDFGANPNSRNTDGTTALWFFISSSNFGTSTSEMQLKNMIDLGASPYASRLTDTGKKEITLLEYLIRDMNYSPVWNIMRRVIFPIVVNDLKSIADGKVFASSDVIALSLLYYVANSLDQATVSLFGPSSEKLFNLRNNLYLTSGIVDPSWKPNVGGPSMNQKDVEVLGYPSFMHVPKSAWTSDEMMAQLKVKVVKVGEYKQESRAFNIYEIQLVHEGLKRVVGVIGNFIPLLLKEHRTAAPALTNPLVLEKALNKLHAKRNLLVKVFPYRSKLDLLMYDFLTIDAIKLGHPGADKNPVLYQNKAGYLNMLLSVDAALRKERYIPTHVQGVVKKSFTQSFMQNLDKTKQKVQPENLALIAEKMQSSLSPDSKSSASLKVDLKPLLVEALTKRPTKSANVKDALAKVQEAEGPIYSLEKISNIPKTVKAQVEADAAKRKEALKTIASFAKKRVSKLTKYFDDSVAYMDSLPKTIRSTIYRAVTGNIMQGPFSPIKRIGPGLLYAEQANARDVFTMVEVVMRAPRFPMRYTLFRGMALPTKPVPGDTEVFQEIPFSTTFISNYATGWILAKKGSSCCLLEVVCHAGTGGLFLSKLPWLDPWTSINASVFQRIAPDNAKARFHIKVNSQNEFLMQPYRLKVIEVRKKNFKNMLTEQLEKLDTHYEYDASQRGLDSLFKEHEHLLDTEIDVYRVQLEPISLYAIDIHNRASLQPELFVGQKVDRRYSTLFYSPEELENDPKLYARLKEIVDNEKYSYTRIIEKGRYVGPKTF